MSYVPICVLVVEDEALLRITTVDHLRIEGFNVFDASNADEAISILEVEPTIDLLFTDIDMPGSMDGLKLAAAVRRRWPPVRIVLTSGKHMTGVGELERQMFVAKPYSHDSLPEILRRAYGEGASP
jgi:CheY-like chemotaxis protein